MEHSLPTSVLRYARENAGLNQGALAPRLGVSPSVVSRLEKAETVDVVMARRYLEAVGSEISKEIQLFYEQVWTATDRPTFLHPDRSVLREIELTLQQLATFEAQPDFDGILARPLHTIQARLHATAEFLQRTDHSIAWIGDIGVGKTTALSRATSLVLTDATGQTRSVFPTGSGRTTVCEVVIKVAPAFGLAVDCLDADDVRVLVVDLVGGLHRGEAGITAELERVVRNMSDLRRRAFVGADGKRGFVDPIREMLAEGHGVEEVVNRVTMRMSLETRTQNQMIISEEKEGGTLWLSENIARINNGQHPGFSVPTRISVLFPSKALRTSQFDLSVVDTKGIEGTTQRPDLRSQLDDQRTVSVLCSQFNDAPGSSALSIVKELVDGGSDAAERERLCLLVLPREGEAKRIRDDNGEEPDTVEDGYAIREYQIAQAFSAHKLPELPMAFFDASRDSAPQIWATLQSRVGALRAGYRRRAEQLIRAAGELVANADIMRSQEARIQIAETIDSVVMRLRELPGTIRPAHANLISQLNVAHPSSIAASVNRKGNWGPFAIHHILGVGVRADANARSNQFQTRIDEQLAGLTDRFQGLADVREMLNSVREDLSDWRQDYLNQSLVIGRAAFKPALDDATPLWKKLAARWGQGSGYRVEIASTIEDWFVDTEELVEARNRVDAGLNQAWQELVLDRLAAATRSETDGPDETSSA